MSYGLNVEMHKQVRRALSLTYHLRGASSWKKKKKKEDKMERKERDIVAIDELFAADRRGLTIY